MDKWFIKKECSTIHTRLPRWVLYRVNASGRAVYWTSSTDYLVIRANLIYHKALDRERE